MDVNIGAHMWLAKAFLPDMVRYNSWRLFDCVVVAFF
jgi:hypothetical protein